MKSQQLESKYRKDDDNTKIVKLNYFKIQRADGPSDTGRPGHDSIKVFANGNQRCPISVTIEFADKDGTIVPVTEQYAIDRIRFIDYIEPRQELPIKDLSDYKEDPDYQHDNKNKIFLYLDAGKYHWYEPIIQKNDAFEADVKAIIAALSQGDGDAPDRSKLDTLLEKMASKTGGLSERSSSPSPNEASLNGAVDEIADAKADVEYVDSQNLPGHQWPKLYLKKAILFALDHPDADDEFSDAQQLIDDAKNILGRYKKDHPEVPVIKGTTFDYAAPIKDIFENHTRYLDYDEYRWQEQDLRTAIHFLLRTSSASPREHKADLAPIKKLNQITITYYVQADLINATTNIAAMIKIKENGVLQAITTANNHDGNDNGDGKGNGRHLFNSSVGVYARRPPQPAPGQPGLEGVDANNELITHLIHTDGTTNFHEAYIGLIAAGNEPLDVYDAPDMPNLVQMWGKKDWYEWVCLSPYRSISNDEAWDTFFNSNWYLRGEEDHEHGHVKDLVKSHAGDDVQFAATNRALIGRLGGKEHWHVTKSQSNKSDVTEVKNGLLYWTDIYGTYHGYRILMSDLTTYKVSAVIK